MEKVGVSFASSLNAEAVKQRYIVPLRATIERQMVGIYSNHVQTRASQDGEKTDHLLVFEVHDFKRGLRVLRVELAKLGSLCDFRLHNLNPSEPY